MQTKFKKIKHIFVHLFVMFCLSMAMLYVFFYMALPRMTNQGKLVQVPDLMGVPIHELEDYLAPYRLRYVVTDTTSYAANLPPFSVLQQFPVKGATVKEYRKIYVTLNAEHPLSVSMPNLIEGSMRQAQLLLSNKGLKLGTVKYVPDITKYAVLEQWHNGKPIAAGKPINQGEAIDIIVGAGLGQRMIEVPNVLNMLLEEADLVLLEYGIHTKIIHHVLNKQVPIGTILRQSPLPETKIRLGTSINLWIADCQ